MFPSNSPSFFLFFFTSKSAYLYSQVDAQLTWLLRCDAGSSTVLLCSPSENKLFCLFEHFYPSASSPLEVSRLRCLHKQSQAQHPILSLSGGWDAVGKKEKNNNNLPWCDPAPVNCCLKGSTDRRSRLYPGGNDGCTGHELNPEHFLMTPDA